MGDPAKGEAHRISKRKRERMADLRGADSSSTEKKSAEENMKLFGATRGEAESQDRCKTKKQKLDPMVFGLKGGVTFESSDECATSGDLETSDGFLKLPSDGNYLNSPDDFFYDETVDTTPRCRAHLLGQKCFKGEYCNKSHSYPKEDKILCKYYREKRCSRTASDCWFYHPKQLVTKPIPEEDRYLLVQPMGHLIRDLLSKKK